MLSLFKSPASALTHRPTLGRLVDQSTTLLMTCVGALILLLAILILLHENTNATKGYRLRGLERDRSVLMLEQEILNMQIAESQALEHLRQDQQIQGMIVSRNPRYITVQSEVAVK